MSGKSFITGFANEFAGKQTRDGQSYFNLENLISTLAFGGISYVAGAFIGKKRNVDQKLGGNRS